MATILVVDDEMGIRELLSEILRDEGHDVLLADNAASARTTRQRLRPDLVLLDIWMPDIDGISLLKEWAASGQLTMPVIMMSGHASIDAAVEATRIGALDFLEKPIALQKLLASVKRGLHTQPVARAAQLTLDAFARSAPLRELKKQLDQIAAQSRHVLLKTPDSGLGELCARSVLTPGKPWLELGTLTTALDIPTLEAHHGGVLFVQSLSALTPMQQNGLALALDRLDKYALRLVLCAPHGLESGQYRGFDDRVLRRVFDVTLALPGFATWQDDVPDLAAHILTHLVESGAVPNRRLSTAALNALRVRPWPGGFGELRGAVKSLALGALEEHIGAQDVTRLLGQPPPALPTLPMELPLREAREAFERLYFEHHLKRDSNMTRLAERTGLERTHLYRKLKQLGLALGRREDGAA